MQSCVSLYSHSVSHFYLFYSLFLLSLFSLSRAHFLSLPLRLPRSVSLFPLRPPHPPYLILSAANLYFLFLSSRHSYVWVRVCSSVSFACVYNYGTTAVCVHVCVSACALEHEKSVMITSQFPVEHGTLVYLCLSARNLMFPTVTDGVLPSRACYPPSADRQKVVGGGYQVLLCCSSQTSTGATWTFISSSRPILMINNYINNVLINVWVKAITARNTDWIGGRESS